MKKIIVLFFVGFVCISADLPTGLVKKIDKTIQELWQNKVIEKELVDLSNQQTLNKDLQLYKLIIDHKLVSYLAISRAKSRIDFFDYMIIYHPDLSIKIIQVLAYREDYGGEIGSKRWLNQFVGKKNSEEMTFGKDIQGISGATISAHSLTTDVQQVTNYLNQLKTKGVL